VKEAVWTYLAQLTRALQMEGVDGRRAGEFVAEIDSHLFDTGADPVEEFGTPFELASQLAARPGSKRPGWVPPTWAMWIVGLVAGLMLVVVADVVVFGWDGSGVPVRARGVVWIAVFLPAIMAFSYFATRSLSGREWTALTGGRALLIILVIAVATTTAESYAGDRVIAYVPTTLFWVVVSVAAPAVIWLVVKRNNPIRFPDHAPHLRRLKRGLLAGRPPEGPTRGSVGA